MLSAVNSTSESHWGRRWASLPIVTQPERASRLISVSRDAGMKEKTETAGLRGWRMIYGWGFEERCAVAMGTAVSLSLCGEFWSGLVLRGLLWNQDVSQGRWIWSTRFIFRCIEWKRTEASQITISARKRLKAWVCLQDENFINIFIFSLMFKSLNSTWMQILIL